jgi:hypothetical protein
MNYCQPHFGKTLEQLNYSDVEVFFHAERVETDQLEFKSIHPSTDAEDRFLGLRKSVCAFLNSGGGLIIWGAPKGEKVGGKKEKIFKGPLMPQDSLMEKDYLVSKISDGIIPLPTGIRINILNKENKFIAVIEIDTSEYSPHQTDNTYFMRIDGQSRKAPHHYIESLFKKIKYPNIEAYLKITKAEVHSNKFLIHIEIGFFNWSPLQNEEQLSFRLISKGKFGKHAIEGFEHNYRHEGAEYFKDPVKHIFYYGEPVYESEAIWYDAHEAMAEPSGVLLMLTFGGKYSPRKSSEYRLNFKKISSSNPNHIIVNRKENKLIKDHQDEKGINKNTIIEYFMKKS